MGITLHVNMQQGMVWPLTFPASMRGFALLYEVPMTKTIEAQIVFLCSGESIITGHHPEFRTCIEWMLF